jgi:hypothetical protein
MINVVKRHYSNKNGSFYRLPFFLLSFIFGLLIMTTSYTATADNAPSIKAWFKFVPEAGSLLVLPMCQAENETLIRYEISANKTGPSGRSQSNQGGQRLLPATQDISLSTLQFGLAENDRYKFEMRIFINNTLVTTVTAKYPL